MMPGTSKMDSAPILDEHMVNYDVETSALHRKLQSKTQALKIIQSQLEKFRTERDQFKLMAETLQLRYSTIKHSHEYNLAFGNSSVGSRLNEETQKNLRLTTEIESLKQKLYELQGDMDVLRDRYAAKLNEERKEFNNVDKKDQLDWKSEKADFIVRLENLKRKNIQLKYDIKSVIDEKEELVSDRDAYRHKVHRLNHELQVALKANESHSRIVDIDSLILENKHLQEKLSLCESELTFAQQSVSKYKNMLDSKRKKGILKLGTNNFDYMISNKQVDNVLDANMDLPTKAETITELKSLCVSLLDNLNDKNTALQHQKRTNKILATRIDDLEKRLDAISGEYAENNFSPSQMLLSGYSPSTVDEQQKGPNVTDDSGTMSSDESNKMSRVFEDRPDPLSSESNASAISSDDSNPGECSDETSSNCPETKLMLPGTSYSLSYVNREREKDLQDLPPEIADMIRKTLHRLDMREIETQRPISDSDSD